ncbi:MAG: sulfotransferase [Planctomycetota bacterium]|nr:sulfotransferase [Planctomycetota bacterium]
MSLESEITIVSGLPRSGTSLMMQMLHCGGMTVVTDGIRADDVDNPRGYLEWERAKQIKTDVSWLADTRGKVFKMVSQLLYDLPRNERYAIIFMERDLDEVLLSQEKMLARSGRPAPPRDSLKRAYKLHLSRLHAWLQRQVQMRVLPVSYHELIGQPAQDAARIREFLGRPLDVEQMCSAVDTGLYRNRNEAADRLRPTVEDLSGSEDRISKGG